MRILVTFAVEAEFAPWRKLRNFRRMNVPGSHRGGPSWHRATIGDLNVDVVLTGISLKGQGLGMAPDRKPNVCISSGLAGALNESFHVGDIVAARAVVSAEATNVHASDRALIDVAERTGARLVNRFLTSTQVLGTSEMKSRAAQKADVVEMEGFGVFNWAKTGTIPSVAVRSISDDFHEDLPLDFQRATDASGRVSLIDVFFQLAQRPGQLPQLIRFGKHSKQAAERLAGFLDRYVIAIYEARNSAGVKETAQVLVQ
jgi:adenosylhomocysteine nucleosidase